MAIISRLTKIADTAVRLCEQMQRLLPELSELQLKALIYRIDSFCCCQIEFFHSTDEIVDTLEQVTLFFNHVDKVKAIHKRCSRKGPIYDNVVKIANAFDFTHSKARLIWDVVYEVNTRRY